jgi:DNA-binding transcriptional ArsR family regulator
MVEHDGLAMEKLLRVPGSSCIAVSMKLNSPHRSKNGFEAVGTCPASNRPIEYLHNFSISYDAFMKKGVRHIIRNDAQLAALASAPRQEIVDVLAELGTVSVARLADTLGRPADALYFHLRRLTRVGLVEHVGYSSRSGRKEALYRTTSPELMLEYHPRRASNRAAVTAIVTSMLRLGIRDFGRAFQRKDVIVSGDSRELWALRRTGRLAPTQLAGINRSIQSLRDAMTNPGGHGRLYAVTVLLTPLDRRARAHPAKGTNPRKSKKGKK